MIAVIIGSTGLVGSILLRKLLADHHFERVISVFRSPIGTTNPKLSEVQIGNLSELLSRQQELQGDVYFCCLGTTIKAAGTKENFCKVDYDAIVDFGKIAKLHTAKSFTVISARGANSRSRIFYSRVKGDTEDALKAMHFNSLTIFRPGLLMGNRKETRPAEKILGSILSPLHKIAPTLAKGVVTNAETLAERMLVKGRQSVPGIHTIEAAEI